MNSGWYLCPEVFLERFKKEARAKEVLETTDRHTQSTAYDESE
jgi:hypothetical protein